MNISSNYDEAIVFINGKSTGKTVTELETFGPVSLNGSLTIHAETNVQGKTLKSDKITLTNNTDYIELWIDDTEIIEAAERKAEAAAAAEAAKEEAILEIEDVVSSHYYYISNGYYSEAYDLFSKGRKAKIDYKKWESGLFNNESNEVKLVVVDSVSGDKAVASFEMVSRDYTEDGEILVQTFGGKWNLVKEFSGWKLSEPDIDVVDSRIE